MLPCPISVDHRQTRRLQTYDARWNKHKSGRRFSRGFTMVVLQERTKPLATLDLSSNASDFITRLDDLISEPSRACSIDRRHRTTPITREWARSPKALRIGESLRVRVPNPDAVFNPTDRALSRETPRARESSLKTGRVCNTSPKTHLPRAVTHGECVNQRALVFRGVSQGSPDETRTMTLWLTL